MPTKVVRRQVNKKPTDGKAARWSDKQKFEAVVSYLMMGNWVIVSDHTGVPVDTLRHWKQQEWWKEMEAQIRSQKNIEVSGKLRRLVDKAFKEVEDRVENGDWHYNYRTGKVERRPVSAKTAGEILVKALDKQVLIDKLIVEQSKEAKEEAVMDRLKSIEARLLEARAIKREPKVIDAEVITGESQ